MFALRTSLLELPKHQPGNLSFSSSEERGSIGADGRIRPTPPDKKSGWEGNHPNGESVLKSRAKSEKPYGIYTVVREWIRDDSHRIKSLLSDLQNVPCSRIVMSRSRRLRKERGMVSVFFFLSCVNLFPMPTYLGYYLLRSTSTRARRPKQAVAAADLA